MPADRDAARAGAVPPANRPLWLVAAWTGAGSALACAIASTVVVAICWLPASSGSGSAGSTIRAGLLAFLAALRGGITVDGVSSAFVPLGMTLVVGAVAWRAGRGLADAADSLDEQRPARLVQAGVVQVLAFALLCSVAAAGSRLGTSSAPVGGVAIAAVILFALTGGVAFVRGSALADELVIRTPDWVGPAARAAAAGVAVYLAAGAVLVTGALLVQHGRVEALSREIGGGWSGAPVLLLGVLAAPNAAVAAASYLAGTGFALGRGSGISLGSSAHGTLPAFPLLGAVPAGPADTAVWLLAAATPILAGCCVGAVAVRHAQSWTQRCTTALLGSAGVALLGAALAWLGGGAIGDGRLSALGASPVRFGAVAGVAVAAASAAALLATAAAARWRSGRSEDGDEDDQPGLVRAKLSAVAAVVTGRDDRGTDERDELAG